MQFMAQTALARAVEANGAKGGTVVVMDPHSGDIYAMATYPWFDPNDFSARLAGCDAQPRRHRLLRARVGEQGHHGGGRAGDRLGGPRRNGSRCRVDAGGPFTIYDSHVHPIETMTLGDIIAESSNIGAGDGRQRGRQRRSSARTCSASGTDSRHGHRVPRRGLGRAPARIAVGRVIRATVSYGQGISVTPLQMADVYATIANGGRWVQPRLVRGLEVPTARSAMRRRAAHPARGAPDTADLLTRMLAYVVEDGTGAEAQIPGYQVAGKTGTSRKLDADGHYVQRYMASFVGFLPASDPQGGDRRLDR